MFNVKVRPAVARVVGPVARGLARRGVSPDVITVTGTVGVLGGSLGFYPRGQWFWGTIVVAAFAFSDMLDGAVARVTGRTGVWGAFLDSTLDRFGDAAVFGGIALFYAGRGHDLLLCCVALACLVFASLTSYIKARAEGLGLRCDVGLAERSERLVVILLCTGLSGLLDEDWIRISGLWFLAGATLVTVGQRLLFVRQQAFAVTPT
ncbi:MAG: CDP-diacylglycerol---glycerol-3-phosphate 3-phosphatidyltransferase [Frankiales bacterium]|jgi:CDP-diacylglycerol--glycerol-3-phosphate 3-phosphatidyltransferase|nr:CDP-diacylglycerol---glycerol-3-phosphate 3-phosphatidyltransferase [Frankiales bacterium]MDX6208875.1 CDP-diacylglycerol---glycerol-3-phosphate 3-phosphatidyltransferase [Frankiales bacterium]MDX6222524.1 CDP-diacylglycerol---glycerol-3-phosphate 3-phosphatidyltransferase [Frankiales bacterium]